MWSAWPGDFKPKESEMPSSGWILNRKTLASRVSQPADRKSEKGGWRNTIAISVARFASRLPVRRKKGTPDQRQLSTWIRAAM